MRNRARDMGTETNVSVFQVRSSAERQAAMRVWIPAWAGCAALGMVNGVARQTLYSERLGEQQAHRLSTATLLPALGAYTYLIDRRHPLPDRATALGVGASWAALTVMFEFGLGRRQGLPWSHLLADYNLKAGRLWALVPVTMALAPAAIEGCRAAASPGSDRPAQLGT